MRIGSSILLWDGYCYQSYNWNKFRPLGNLQNVINFLESYQCDEVSIIRPIRNLDSMESFKRDIDTLLNVNCMTPLSFGGGLRDIEHIKLLHELPIERLIFSSSFINKDIDLISYATSLYGHQAIQCILPFTYKDNEVYIFSSILNKFISIKSIDFQFVDKYANEIILLDTYNEGLANEFNANILNDIEISNSKLIISGGIGKNDIRTARNNNIASVLIDNKVLHSEYSIKGFKDA